jgi:hypothetical protein
MKPLIMKVLMRLKKFIQKSIIFEGLTQGSGVADFVHFCQLLLLTPVSENPLQPLMPHHIKKIQKVEKLKLKCCSLVTLVFSAVAELLTLHLSRNLSAKRR